MFLAFTFATTVSTWLLFSPNHALWILNLNDRQRNDEMIERMLHKQVYVPEILMLSSWIGESVTP
jgi:hypothetical protein